MVSVRVRLPTQLRLKQSCEQKKLSRPIFRHVGHWSVPASLGHSSPRHFQGAATSAVMFAIEPAEVTKKAPAVYASKAQQLSWKLKLRPEKLGGNSPIC